MKFIRLATIAALSSTILAGGATAAFAQEVRDVMTDGQVEFIPAGEDDGDLVVIPPEEDPDVEIDLEVSGTTGPLSIVKAVQMNFGSQVISNQDQVYSMIAERQRERDTNAMVPYVSFAQVQDLRGTNAGWNLQVSLGEFTSNTLNNVLTGAEVSLLDPRIHYAGANSLNEPTPHADELRLIPTAGAVSVMHAAQGQGAGASSVVWGDQSHLNELYNSVEIVRNDAIQLFVPGSTVKDATTYTATLLWELTATPDPNAGETM